MPDTASPSGLRKRLVLLALAALLPLSAHAQTLTPPTSPSKSEPTADQPAPAPTPTPASTAKTTPAAQEIDSSAIAQLTQSNHDLLELLKKQQGVLEDMQYDRRLQSRQIDNLEVRLTETLQQNDQLQAKIEKLQTQLDTPPPTVIASSPPGAPTPAPTQAPPVPTIPPPTPPPATYLPPAEPNGAPGVQFWHRIYSLSGTENELSDHLHIEGHHWRVLWHNQDKDGDVYKNTSALFINAFPKGDTIPQKVCAKVGSGGDTNDLIGPGDFVLKVEASGGKWELAVEDFY